VQDYWVEYRRFEGWQVLAAAPYCQAEESCWVLEVRADHLAAAAEAADRASFVPVEVVRRIVADYSSSAPGAIAPVVGGSSRPWDAKTGDASSVARWVPSSSDRDASGPGGYSGPSCQVVRAPVNRHDLG
jgi:hypothetical protein